MLRVWLICMLFGFLTLNGCDNSSQGGGSPTSNLPPNSGIVGSWSIKKNMGMPEETHGVFIFSQLGTFDRFDTLGVCFSDCTIFHASGTWNYIGTDSLVLNNTATVKSIDGANWKTKTPDGIIHLQYTISGDSLIARNGAYSMGMKRL